MTEIAGATPFPSLEWFERLGKLMEHHRARHEHLGYVDCTAGFCVTDGQPAGGRWTVLVRFEEFSVVDLREASSADVGEADFILEAPLAVWREMIESIAAGRGRPDLEHTLNRLSHMGTPIRLVADDPLRKDLYFRYNQSLQEFVNASAEFETSFPATARS
jgi:hypothetical protein